MSTLLIHSRNISIENLRSYFPQHIRILTEEEHALQFLNDREATITVSVPDLHSDDFQLIPTASVAAHTTYGYQCCLRRESIENNTTREIALAGIGVLPDTMGAGLNMAGEIEAHIDSFIIRKNQRALSLVFYLYAEDIHCLLAQPFLLSVSITPLVEVKAAPGFAVDAGHDIQVPAKSQMIYSAEIQKRICSPTCLSMVLDCYGRSTDPVTLAEQAYHKGHDLYGVWSSNIWAASHYNCLGYIHRFSGFDEMKGFLDNDIPLIASISYRAGELTNAAIQETSGHLVVVRGYNPGVVIVNDPAAPDYSTVKRAYVLDEFMRAWLGHKAVAYVLLPPAA